MSVPERKCGACPVAGCGYWRQEKATGVHMAANPADPKGAYLTHQLVEVEYVAAPAIDIEREGR